MRWKQMICCGDSWRGTNRRRGRGKCVFSLQRECGKQRRDRDPPSSLQASSTLVCSCCVNCRGSIGAWHVFSVGALLWAPVHWSLCRLRLKVLWRGSPAVVLLACFNLLLSSCCKLLSFSLSSSLLFLIEACLDSGFAIGETVYRACWYNSRS